MLLQSDVDKLKDKLKEKENELHKQRNEFLLKIGCLKGFSWLYLYIIVHYKSSLEEKCLAQAKN